jgi:integrase
MRLGEQYGCTWGQVHFERRTIELRDTKNGEDRTVHLNRAALEVLERRSAEHPKNAKPTDLVLPRPRKGQAGASNRSWFDPCTEEARITDYLWHGNRHTFGSWSAMADATIKEIQGAGGWKTIQMAGRYTHLSPVHKGYVVESITTPRVATPANRGKASGTQGGISQSQSVVRCLKGL